MSDQAFYIEQMNRLAEVGAALCCYAPGSGNPDEWPTARCDCKRLPDLFSVLRGEYIQLGGFRGEQTGCCEVREAWRAMDTLRERNQLEGLWASGRAPWRTW